MSKWEEKNRLSDEIIKKLEGTDASALKLVVEKLGIGVVTKHLVVKRDDLICDPIIWVAEDLESVTQEQWNMGRGYKTLNERSVEEGQQIRADLEWMVENE
ncbi:hypothetical protein N9045_01865 [bacterium]|nr:hypothetical protein [bacterium]